MSWTRTDPSSHFEFSSAPTYFSSSELVEIYCYFQNLTYGIANKSWCYGCHSKCEFDIKTIRFTGDFNSIAKEDSSVPKSKVSQYIFLELLMFPIMLFELITGKVVMILFRSWGFGTKTGCLGFLVSLRNTKTLLSRKYSTE